MPAEWQVRHLPGACEEVPKMFCLREAKVGAGV